MAQIAVIADGDNEGLGPRKAQTCEVSCLCLLDAASEAIAESRRVSALASDELIAWAGILHRAA